MSEITFFTISASFIFASSARFMVSFGLSEVKLDIWIDSVYVPEWIGTKSETEFWIVFFETPGDRSQIRGRFSFW